MEEAIRAILLGVSALAAGIALYSALRHGKDYAEYHREADLWLVFVNVGVAGIVILIGQIVFGAEGVPFTWQAVAYGAFLVCLVVGLVGLAHAQHRSREGNHKPA